MVTAKLFKMMKSISHVIVSASFVLSLSVPVTTISQAATPIKLSQKAVAERVMQDSAKVQETQWSFELGWLEVLKTQSKYDWATSFESGLESSQLEDFAGRANPRDQTYTSLFKIQKPLPTGTLLGFSLQRKSIKSDFAVGITPTVPDSQTQDLLGVSLEQNLWRNFFGEADRSQVKSAEFNFRSNQITREDQLQVLVLEGIRQFWKTYVKQEVFQEALSSRQRYDKLVEVVRRKSRLGYANPGEVPQLEAELEVRNQKVKEASVDYLASLDDLLTLLKLPRGSEIQFEIPEELPPSPPALTETEIEKLLPNLRVIKASDLKLEALSLAITQSESLKYPDLSLIGNWYTGGLDQSSSEATSEMLASTHPKYYVGLRFQATWGSGSTTEEIRNRRLQRQIEESKRTRSINELRDQITNSYRKVQATKAIVTSIRKQTELREKAANELQRSYQQGRTDISIVIDSLNKFFASQVSYSQANGDFQTALNEYAALRDELVVSPQMKSARSNERGQ